MPKATPQKDEILASPINAPILSPNSTPSAYFKYAINKTVIAKLIIQLTRTDAESIVLFLVGETALRFAFVDKFASYWKLTKSPHMYP